MTRRIWFALPALTVLACCSSRTEAPARTYPMKGEVKSVDPAGKMAVIAHEKIGDWMEAMTMEFPIQPDEELSRIKPGDRIEATVVVGEVKYYVTGIKVIARHK
jgi:Cu/Ag efflux protein CusF